MFDFSEHVVMVTGADGNLGRATVQAFSEAGADLILVGHHLEQLQEAFPELAESERHLFTAVDLRESGAVEGLVYEALQQFERLDVLVNIAGGFRMGTPVHETTPELWEFMLDLNARTVLNTARAVIPHMLQQGSGRVINTAARAALEGKAKMAAYTASKSAVVRLTESMAAELKAQGINVNCILPGTIDTPENREAMPKARHERWVAPEAIADVILFLASPAARALHGACVPVYGLS